MNKQKIFQLITQETKRQQNSLVMIASENYASSNVLKAMGTPLSNKYSEGYPGKRYYTGNQFIDEIETAAQALALKMFGLNDKNWHANVQPHSGSSANLAAYLGLLKPGDKILALDLGAGGHLTHGSPVNFSGQLFNFVHYSVNPRTGKFNYQEIARITKREKPKMIVCGATAYTQKINFKKFGAIAASVNALMLADIAHIAGLIIAKVHPSPFPYADVVTSTTHKTLRGPRSAFIICKKTLAKQIDRAIFPGLQGGPQNHITAAKAVCFQEALSAKFARDQKQTVKNAQTLAQTLIDQGLKLVAESTENHLVLIDCQNLNLSGKQGAELLAEAAIYTNANMIPFDPATPLNPSGIRIGTPALTTRGLKDKEMKQIGQWIAQILHNPADQKLRQQIKQKVFHLTKKFPLY
ncbi:MAG TPA: serine hydroxymethyltransferase [bacterium]|nr:serine hydroxymethyltransferase [bacterium]HNS34351.1 serine hydroxymethyltransferase [bacterium]HNZ73546.1 serine hydroxymethyltransferase [bacterium]HOH67546.1 serine hydroxymethyltransferase [bacterium]HQA63535.1 serine hydroxymethyltransferase [bacterium]